MIAQSDILEDAEIKLVGTEEVDGIDCYVFDILSTKEAFTKAVLLGLQTGEQGGARPGEYEQILFSALLMKSMDMSAKYWVAKEKYYVKKTEMVLKLDLLPLMYMSIKADMNMGSLYEPVIIDLPFYEDDFSDPRSGWEQRSDEDVEQDYKDGEYHIFVKRPWREFTAWNENARQFKDFALEVDARLVSGSKDIMYGLIFRVEDSKNYYSFVISGDGYYIVGGKLDGWYFALEGQAKSAFINEGNSRNRLKIVCKGSQIEVYINGHHLTTVKDYSFAEGFVGMTVNTHEAMSDVAFDNIRVYSLD